MWDLNGKVAWVTGGARGLGKAMLQALVEHGARGAVLDLLEAEGRATAQELAKRFSREVVFAKVNVASPEEVQAKTQELVEQTGIPDIVVCAAGIVTGAPAEDFSVADWQRTLDVNLSDPLPPNGRPAV